MYAEKIIAETDPSGNIKGLPSLPANSRFEVIFLQLDSDTSGYKVPKRTPHPALRGSVQFHGDVIDTVAESDWDSHT
ncbi:MAG: hypothetical protein LC641_14060 [Spirochaeta sp.]|nr:hypothetical protein [Spirochaeta sp.]